MATEKRIKNYKEVMELLEQYEAGDLKKCPALGLLWILPSSPFDPKKGLKPEELKNALKYLGITGVIYTGDKAMPLIKLFQAMIRNQEFVECVARQNEDPIYIG